jgi:PDZ domain-containing protein
VRQRNAERLIASETAATTAALRQLGVPFTVQVEVDAVQPGLPAEGKLQQGDVLTSVDGEPVSGSEDLRNRVSGREPGTTLTIGYQRDGAAAEAELVTAAPPSGDAKSVIGVQLAEVAEYPFEVTITLKDVGGPSAGLMFALGILDKLGPESLTGGLYIAGHRRDQHLGRRRGDRRHQPEGLRGAGQGGRRVPRARGQLRGGQGQRPRRHPARPRRHPAGSARRPGGPPDRRRLAAHLLRRLAADLLRRLAADPLRPRPLRRRL